jgi:hypothetical protein
MSRNDSACIVCNDFAFFGKCPTTILGRGVWNITEHSEIARLSKAIAFLRPQYDFATSISTLVPSLLTFSIATMILTQHLLALIHTSEEFSVVADNAIRLVSSATDADRTKKHVSRPLQEPTVSMDTLPVLPRSGLNQTELIDEKNESRSIPSLCSASIASSPSGSGPRSRRKQAKRCSAKSLSKKLNTPRIKSISRWDSGSLGSDDASSLCTSNGQQQSLSDLATQKYHDSMDQTNHCPALPLRLPRRQDSDRGLNTAAMIEKMMVELDLNDSENEDFVMKENNNHTVSPAALGPSC